MAKENPQNVAQETKQQKSIKNTNKIVDKSYTDPKTGKFVEGNPGGGRPPGTFSLITLLKQELQKCPEGQDKKTYADLIVKRMLKESIEKGDIQQIKLIWNYIEGMPLQKIGGDKDNPLSIIISSEVAQKRDITSSPK